MLESLGGLYARVYLKTLYYGRVLDNPIISLLISYLQAQDLCFGLCLLLHLHVFETVVSGVIPD